MKRKSVLVLFVTLILAACSPVPTPTITPSVMLLPTDTPTSIATATVPPPTETSTATPVIASPVPLPTQTSTATPIATFGKLAYYRLRIEYITTSDWTTLELRNPHHILTMRLLGVSGKPSNLEAGIQRLSLNQPLEVAKAGHSVGMTVDYAFEPAVLEQPLEFLLQKGALNGSTVHIYSVSEKGTTLIQTIDHQIVVKSNTDLNPRKFMVNLSALKNTPPLLTQINSAFPEKMLWAFYYPWYSLEDWNSQIFQDHPLVRYASNDIEIIKKHVEQAQRVGIDGFISSWWGPDSDTDQNLKKLLQVAQEKNFKVAIDFETLTDSGPRDKEEIYHWLTYAISNYGKHPAYMRVNGKPVFIIWASDTLPLDAWKQLFTRLREDGNDAFFIATGYSLANLDVFDSVHEYTVFTISDLAQTFKTTARGVRLYPLLVEGSTPKIWIATVQPGYDERTVPGRTGLFQERQSGAFYRSTFEAALASNPDWIFITSWNEWGEHTYIEPSERYGDLYLQITREYAEKWKGK